MKKYTKEAIEADEEYPFSQACLFLRGPSGRPLSLKSLHRWREKRRFEAICRTSGSKRYWSVTGRELLKLLDASVRVQPAAVQYRRATDAGQQNQDSLNRLKALGIEL